MHYLLKQFWEWLPISYEEYAINGISQTNGSCEDSFPHFRELLSYAELIVKKGFVDDEHIYDLLTIMGIDNETESVLDFIENEASDYQIQHISSTGITHSLYNTRWQLAELICRRKPTHYGSYLQTLLKDIHPYVKRRARNCIEKMENEHMD